MWAIGACTFALLSKISPFRRNELHETQNAVIEGDYNFDDPSWDTRSQDSKDFIRKLLQTCPEVSSINQALNSVLMTMNSIKRHNTDFHKISFKKFTLKQAP